ncbi:MULTISPECIES: DUF4279 domain-containing protein [unclassified Mesorhizobium]|uniref:DUF4279 domain-containing protein n=1 Tax=unclassified Mesorhizobium TaxID=325217 RepID=UPI00086A545C|nr:MULTISPECIES: DUF4279 domain-containing protein [unclassified Mesorhizobium]MBN9258424.1 DUF4279 domain-containing protein [Mesorhizobium sp.]MBN9270301.1 DUF4279 domain-containing protein [Mesorhizobium sp.]ODT15454.1 MAG: hypothetical protein ABS57_13100 [Mesorhizobium sp. SCN 65-12]OJX82447.1 MAG: hypothetical protein BGO93_25025 [Mesorhizobium sp. 65-26]
MINLSISDFDADPDRVTAILGIEPTSIVRKGDPMRSGLPRQRNGWSLAGPSERLRNGVEHENAVNYLIEQMRGREEAFARLRREVRPKQIAIYGGFYQPYDEQCGIWLEPLAMRVLADCGVGWGLDLFVEDEALKNDSEV